MNRLSHNPRVSAGRDHHRRRPDPGPPDQADTGECEAQRPPAFLPLALVPAPHPTPPHPTTTTTTHTHTHSCTTTTTTTHMHSPHPPPNTHTGIPRQVHCDCKAASHNCCHWPPPGQLHTQDCGADHLWYRCLRAAGTGGGVPVYRRRWAFVCRGGHVGKKGVV